MARQDFSLFGVYLDEQNFEVPQDLKIGLETWMSVHRIPQTSSATPKIIIQTWGVFPKPIEWEARFLRATADLKIRKLTGFMVSQQVGQFTFGNHSWDCVIAEFEETYRSRWDIGYRVRLEPLKERSGRTSNAVLAVDATTSLNNAYQNITGARNA